ncbi:serine/threonine protein kinase [Actinoplanes italicus]|uniref:non-specific serine/threonine protein kinase n=1 Tax=Actinoplanes italicus TaxID=113567 RepID=A0A2T0KHI0_9ACTN|nr:class III lanthionine synthetase LanKC [Actinoplanes italicus]PRX22899.1 lanthionine synthetase-like protein [Actinoplanes italicus]GIE28420.1 serine/threonine protein kinase [Actinoplanes italicus]
MKVNLQQLAPYCLADPDFFEHPDRLSDAGQRFAAADRPAPAGWRRSEHGLWVSLRPLDVTLPAQGWKIHVSARLEDAARVCDIVTDHCLAERIPFKLLRSRRVAHLLNGKYADRSGSGKLLTVYPPDEAALARTLPALSAALTGTAGSYILSDLRYGDSGVFVRWGGFADRTVPDEDGRPVPAVQAPDGTLVPDQRGTSFTLPPWVDVPEVLRPDFERWRDGDGDGDFPYEVSSALHYSNGGGVYLARDTRTGEQVVLREARPHAGLDSNGDDAVTRLRREHTTLLRLQGLDCVPRLIEYRQAWEHHFLVEEYIEGATLLDTMLHRQPLVEPDPEPGALASYTAWALDVADRLDRALAAVHARGLRYGDLHPGNVLLRPDGRVVLVDFELATDLADRRPPALGAPGFTPPAHLSGSAADRHLLDRIRLWLLLPLDVHPQVEPHRLATLVRGAERLYPLPDGFGTTLLRRLRRDAPPTGSTYDTAGDLLAADHPDWPAIRDSLVAGILATASPGRSDRLFPGDPEQFADGGLSLAHGAAGVLHALHRAGATIPGEHVDWLADAARRATRPRAGLYTGLHGVAGVLHDLGRTDDALEILGRAAGTEADVSGAALLDGQAGIALTLLRFAQLTGDTALRIRALHATAGLTALLDGHGPLRPPAQGGLLRGSTGTALLLLHLYEDTGDTSYLDRAAQALHLDAARGEHLPNGTFQLVEGGRYLVNLDAGSGGIAIVAASYLRHRSDPALSALVDGVRRGSRVVLLRQPGLLRGRASLITTLAALRHPDDEDVLREHVRRLAWHARTHHGHLAFPGTQLLRLSADLATGSAGILLALNSAFESDGAVLPYLEPRSTAPASTQRR